MRKILPFILIVIVLVGAGFYLKAKLEERRSRLAMSEAMFLPGMVDMEKYVSVVGLVGYSGLSPSYKTSVGLQYSDLQVDNFNTEVALLPGPSIQGIYLEKAGLNSTLLVGKCVLVTGQVKEGWLGAGNSDTGSGTGIGADKFRRVAVLPQNISILPFDRCNSYPVDSNQYDPTQASKYTGVIDRNVRPSPDVDYDYKIIFSSPIKLIEDRSALIVNARSEVSVVPVNYKVRMDLEQSIGKRVEISGIVKWGYGTSEYILVVSVDTL